MQSKQAHLGRALLLGAVAFGSTLLVAATDRETAIMDEIEHAVRLPQRAEPLDHYTRNYTYLGDGTVIGVYVLGDMIGNKPGRAWVPQKQLPQVSDGGCSIVTVFYNPKTKAAPETMCNPSI